MKFELKALAKALSANEPEDLSGVLSKYAAVALIIRVSATGKAKIGYIKRADHVNDRWAGQTAFPGGKHEPEDRTSLDTAIRETYEEIGVQLTIEDHLGRLGDIHARSQLGLQPFFIRPHVFGIFDKPKPKLDYAEVAAFGWVDLSWFLDPKNRQTYSHATPSGARELPSFILPDKSILWGLTYMMTEEFLKLITQHKLLGA